MSLVAGASCSLVLAEPIVYAIMQEHAASVGVDVYPLVVRPDFPRPERGALGGCRQYN